MPAASAERFVLLALAVAALAGCSDDRSPTMPADRLAAPIAPLNAEVGVASLDLLWGQLSTVDAFLIGSGAGHIVTATEFVVPAGRSWTVSRVVLAGSPGKENPSVAMSLAVRADETGVPGAVLASHTLDPVVGTGPGYAEYPYDLPAPLLLIPGTYWLVGECSVEYFLCALVPAVGQSALSLHAATGTWNPYISRDFAFGLYGMEQTAEERLLDLQTMLDGFGLAAGISNSLDAKLRAALEALAAGDAAAACLALQDFINEADALAGKKLTQAHADALIAEAARVRGILGC